MLNRITILTLALAMSSCLVNITLADNAWTGAAGDGQWTTSGNWSLGHVPDWADGWILVDDAGTVTCTTTSGAVAGWAQWLAIRGQLADTTVDFNLGPEYDAGGVYIGQHFGTSKQAFISALTGYSSTVNLNSGELKIGAATAGDRRLRITGAGTATLNANGDSYMLHKGIDLGTNTGESGILTVNDNALVETWGYMWLGAAAGGTGTLTINGGEFRINGNYLDVGVFGDGTINVDGGLLTINNNTLYLGDEPGVTGTLNVSSGTAAPKYLMAGLDGIGTINVTGGNLSVGNWLALGSVQDKATGGTGTLNVSGGHVSCGASSLVVGDTTPGSGLLVQTGGLIGIYRYDQSGDDGLIVGQGNSSGLVKIHGGELYSYAIPVVDQTGNPNNKINIDNGAKLRVNRYKLNAQGGQAALEAMITAGQITGGASDDTNVANFRIRNESAIENPFGIESYMVQYPIPACELRVRPYDDQDIVASAAQTQQITYTLTNFGETDPINYTVTENPEASWLTLDKTSGSLPLTADTDTVTATIDVTGMSAGNYTTDLVFTADCTSVQSIRTINLTVLENDWTVLPKSTDKNQIPGDVTVFARCRNPMTYNFTVTNTLGDPITFTVEETDANGDPQDHAWLTLNTTSGGPLAVGESASASFTVQPDTGTDDVTIDGWVKITSSIGFVEIRQIQMTTAYIGTIFGGKWAYWGDVMPTEPNSCGTGCTFTIKSNNDCNGLPFGTIVDDPEAVNGKAFHFDQYGTDGTDGPDPVGRNFYQSDISHPVTGENNNYLSGRLGATMVCRVKVTRNGNAGPQMLICDDAIGDPLPYHRARVNWGGAGPSKTRDLVEDFNSIKAANIVTIDEKDDYHIVRIGTGWGAYGSDASNPNSYHLFTIKIWFNEDPTPVIDITDSENGVNWCYDAFLFGTMGTGSLSKVYYDWISFTDTGIFAPGEENDCIGPLVYPFGDILCPDPFADADEDGDVDQDDFALFQLCYTGTGGGVPDNCDCFNRDGDDDVDSTDYGKFENCASGPAVPADITCDDAP